MSALKNQITQDIKTAMKAREMDKVKVLRNLQAALKQIEIDQRVELDDTVVLATLQKQIKQRQESIAVFAANGRDDLAQNEQFELDIIQTFMPAAMSEAELTDLVRQEIAAQQASSMQDMGKVMNALKAKTTGRADPATLSKLVKSALI